MGAWRGRYRDRYAAGRARVEAVRDGAYARPGIGRAVRSYQRYYTLGMQHVAGSVTYFGILSLFPLVALVYAVAGHVVARQPQLQAELDRSIQQTLGVDADLGASVFAAQAKASVRAVTTTLGVLGLLYAGRLWVDAGRRALRTVWGPGSAREPGFVRGYVRDLVVLVVFLAAVLVLLGLAVLALGGPFRLAASDGHAVPLWGEVAARVAGAALAAGWGALICGWLFRRLGGAPRDARVAQASWAGGAGLTAMAVAALFLLRHALTDPLYGLPLVVIGLMLWVSGLSRLLLSLAVWASTPDAPQV
ncbi:YhjD/YihY/BrkB family envelope integrity protein [Actinomadura parmotrematis]|uniref:YihY/virulence factor BrkB family protein n=1 Tax=Actinomadura parmotrematis TaxID=2864039 RepID=A0ABS7FNB1_9ACTN|nr:YhjD/YihY/BrkB family envelope integrity protein [Actinomadura parmotrematis]MBW8481879.1 YihY/virulence factor BrkB family protein [Actinomadura parmotrematis]